MPDRIYSVIAADEDLAALEKPLAALQRPLLAFMQRERSSGVWLLLPGVTGAATLRRAIAPSEGNQTDSIDLEVVSAGDGQVAARELVEQLQAWDSAGRPRQEQLRIRAVEADAANTQPRPGEHFISRPWINFLVSYNG